MLASDEVPIGGSGICAEPELWDVATGQFTMVASATTFGDGTYHCHAVDSVTFVHGGHKAMHVWSLPQLAHRHKLTLLTSGTAIGALRIPDAQCMDIASVRKSKPVTEAEISSKDRALLAAWLRAKVPPGRAEPEFFGHGGPPEP